MNLIQPLLSAIEQCGYQTPTPIQRETIPPVLSGKDVLGCAQTGTGKTAAFALPILQRLSKNEPKGKGYPIRTLVLTPTRELALQIYENFLAYGKKLPLRSCVIFGGVGQQPQVDALQKGVDILVATPGRLNDLIGQGYISLANLEIFVLDEADRMLDMGFIHDVKRVIAQLPAKRQTLFFSATMPEDVESLALSILTDPVTVKVDPVSSTVDTIRQYLYMVDKANKRHLLADLLQKPNVESALVFTRTKHGADRVVRELSKAGVKAKAIHGDKSQTARQEALSQFKKGKIHVLIATDIAARGIDIAGLSHVFNYDLPSEPESYVHRIGRTGRAGHEGVAISFCCIDEMKQLRDIEKLINKKLNRLESQWPMQVFTETVKQPRPTRQERLAAQQQAKEQKLAKQAAQKEAAKPDKKAEKKDAKPAAESKRLATLQKDNAQKERRSDKPTTKREKTDVRDQRGKQAKNNKSMRDERAQSNKQDQRSKRNEPSRSQKAAPAMPAKLEQLKQKTKPSKSKGAKQDAAAMIPTAEQQAGKKEKLPSHDPKAFQVLRTQASPAINTRFGPGSSTPVLCSTPLERPVSRLTTAIKEEKLSHTESKKPMPETNLSYQQYMAKQRSQRSRLSTGDDRK